MKKQVINAVHENDLEKFLSDIEVLQPLLEGKIICAFCGDVVSKETLLCVYPEGEEVKVCCNKSGCHKTFLQLHYSS